MTIRKFAVTLLAVLVLVGCSLTAQQSTSKADPSSPTSGEMTKQALPEPTEYLFPFVPLYPAASKHAVHADQRAIMNIAEEEASRVVAWYQGRMQTAGWREEDTGSPLDKVLLFTRDGRYVSIAGHDAPGGGSVMWLHMRTTKEVTEQDALTIARNTHRIEAEWTATLVRDFEREDGDTIYKRPVWVVKAEPGNDAVWVDAITAEPFRIRQ
jgi:hypothetical protein